jgi:hypothetical protein
MKPQEVTLFSGGARGTETAFGEAAEAYGIAEVNFTFEGHHIKRSKNARLLSEAELEKSDIMMEEVGKRLLRDYSKSPWMRKILQSIWYQVNNGLQIFIVGAIQADGTVKGGTGWAAELGKMFNRPLHVFDQERGDWYVWRGDSWVHEVPVIRHKTFCGTGTRNLNAAGEAAIKDLFKRSFGK